MTTTNIRRFKKTDPVEVYCRIRPLSDNEETCLTILNENNLVLQIPECSASFRSGVNKQLIYSFQKIFDEGADQKAIFEEIGFPLVQELLNGRNGLLFTYGVTGSGKTFTMMGNQQNPGLLQRCLDTIFNSITFQQTKRCIFKPDKLNSFDIQSEGDAAVLVERQQKKDLSSKSHSSQKTRAQADTEKLVVDGKIASVHDNAIYAVFVSCVEIYNNYIYDLLDEASLEAVRRGESKEAKSLKEDSRGSMYIKEMVEVEVKSTEEAIELMHRAQRRRVVAYTDLNAESSRSHSIFSIRVVQAAFDPITNDFNPKSKSAITVSQLSLVDLAGSERTKRTKNIGSRLKEAGNINSSLMALRNCIETLRENCVNASHNRKMVPYRDSKLTMLFKNYFEGNGRIKMILCANPSAQEFDETINVLKFSDLVKDVVIPSNGQDLVKLVYDSKGGYDSANSRLILDNMEKHYYSFAMNCPSLQCDSYDDENIQQLIHFLEEFSSRRQYLEMEAKALHQFLFAEAIELKDENERVKRENMNLQQLLEAKTKKEAMLENKIRALEKFFTDSAHNTRTPAPVSKENVRPQLPFPTPTPSTDTETIEKHRYNKEPDTPCVPTTPFSNRPSSRIANQINKFNNAVNVSSALPPPSTPFTASQQKVMTTKVVTSTTTTHALNTQITHGTPYQNRYAPPSSRPGVPITYRGGVPVANKRGQRRSRSAENWLDHRPQNTTKTDTVMQPKMNRKKSVSKLELADTKKSTKYVLTHQQQDSDGELVTNLIKGDVINSPCGGANIIFTDVETLRIRSQEVPKPCPKRPSADMMIDDRLLIEERCSVAIEGHSNQIRKTIK